MKSIKTFAVQTLFATILLLAPQLSACDMHEVAAHGLLDAMQFEKTVTKSTDAMITMELEMAPELKSVEADIRAFYAKYMDSASLRDDMVAVYKESYTTEELRELAAFYRSELGQKTLVKMPEIAKQSVQIAQKRVMEHFEEFRAIVTPR